MSDHRPGDITWPAYARLVIERTLRRLPLDDLPLPADAGRPHSGVFVTLRRAGRLRGCMGTLDAAPPLPEALRRTAVMAAFEDPRFPPLNQPELADLAVEVSIMSPPRPMTSLDDLVLGRHGIIVQHGHRRGLFLPQVATDHRMDKETFLSRCAHEKAGLAPDAWRDPATEVLLFETDVHHDA